MEFKEFYKERERMCKNQKGAIIYERCFCDCPLNNAMTEYRDGGDCLCDYWIARNPEKAEKIVSKWAKEHPVVTNRNKFKEVFGFNIMTKPEKEEDLTMNRDELLSRVEKWLQQEYQPPKKKKEDD